ncbi:3-alpha domain-containing protein [Thiovibrio frasassiensis]|uniref:3-alpha domain-containing protein n=1 Tax=Thiovibrio frasassiensis TaxID=2984131 RepID=UPI003530F4EA
MAGRLLPASANSLSIGACSSRKRAFSATGCRKKTPWRGGQQGGLRGQWWPLPHWETVLAAPALSTSWRESFQDLLNNCATVWPDQVPGHPRNPCQ